MRTSRWVGWIVPWVLASCATSGGTPLEPAPGAGHGATPAWTAFVVVTDEETVVVPIDAQLEVRRSRGLWVLDESNGNVVRPPPPPESLGKPTCLGTGSDDACTLPARITLVDTLVPSLDAECACVVGDATVSCRDDPFAELGLGAWEATSGVTWQAILQARRASDEGEDDEESYEDELTDDSDDENGDEEDCSESSMSPVSLHGGVLYSEGFEHNGCGGLNLYGTFADATALTEDAEAMAFVRSEEVACDPNGAFLDGWAQPSAEDLYFHRDGQWYLPEGAEEDDYALERCDGFDSPDGVVAFGLGTHVMVVGADIDGMGGGARFTQRLTGRDRGCTAADPCGDTHDFESVAGAETGEVPFFVSNDEQAALRIEDHVAAVFAPNRAEATRSLTFAGRLWGVRFHRDASRLVRAMAVGASSAESTAACEGDDCRARCDDDLDCRGSAGCEAICVSGRCSTESVDCRDDHPCGAGQRCENARCRDLALATADAEFVDRRGGTEWGNRCVAHLREGRLDEAQAACAAGLATATRAGTRGALLYNLGLVAERRGARFEARLYYEASLVVRPNETVARALEAAGGGVRR